MARDDQVIAHSVRQSFGADLDDSFVMGFLDELRGNLREAERRTRRGTQLILLLAAAFELINRGNAAEASFFFIRVTSLDFVALAIPVIVAYQLFEISGGLTDANDLYWVHAKVMESRYPGVSAQGLDLFLIPTGDPFGQVSRSARFHPRGRVAAAMASARFPLQILLPGLVGYVFEAYAVSQLFARRGPTDGLVWMVCVAAFVLLLLAASSTVRQRPHGWDGFRGPQAGRS